MAMKEAFSFSVIGHIGRNNLQKLCKDISYAAYNTFESIDATVISKNQKLILMIKHLKGNPVYLYENSSLETNLKKRGLKIEHIKENSFTIRV